jgi:uncharacterized protein (TIGR02996 family)
MMTVQEQLLAAIRDDPEDDAVRLVYADWLEEHGDPDRAEFIRGQILLATLDDHDPRWEGLARRSDRLLARHGQEWAADVPGPGVRRVAFRRGLLECVHATAHAFATRGGAWAARAPVRAAYLDRVEGRVRQLAACRHADSLTELGLLGRRVDDEDVAGLLRSPHLAALTALTVRGSFDGLAGTRLSDGALRRLADAHLPALASLRLASLMGFRADSVARLLRSGAAPRLRQLHLAGTGIDDAAARAVAAAPHLENLEDVALEVSAVGDEGLLALMTSRLPRLARVRLFLSLVTPEGLGRLAAERCTPGVKYLDLSATQVWTVDLDALGSVLRANPALKVSLAECPLPPAVRAELSRRFPGRVGLEDPDPDGAWSTRALPLTGAPPGRFRSAAAWLPATPGGLALAAR